MFGKWIEQGRCLENISCLSFEFSIYVVLMEKLEQSFWINLWVKFGIRMEDKRVLLYSSKHIWLPLFRAERISEDWLVPRF